MAQKPPSGILSLSSFETESSTDVDKGSQQHCLQQPRNGKYNR